MTVAAPNRPRAIALAVLAALCLGRAWAAEGEPVKIEVKRFEIAGAASVEAAELQQVLAPWRDRPVTREDLLQAARAIERDYQERHHLVARVTLPAQDVTEGVVRLQVVEARFGKVRVASGVKAISPEQAQAIVSAAQSSQDLLRIDAVENATAVLNGWPGLMATSSLQPGDASGETDLAITLADRRPWDASVRLDNEGARATGHARAIADGSFVLPGGRGQVLGATLLASEGSQLLRLSGSMPVSDNGLRANVYGSALHYHLVTPEFNALDVKGPSNTLGTSLEWAVQRTSQVTTDLSASFERRKFRNEALGQTLSDYHVDALTLRAAQQRLEPRTGASLAYELSAVSGRVDLSDSPNQAADAMTARTAGHYAVLRGTVQRAQAVLPGQNWTMRLAAQTGSRNLDVSERLAIAGPSGVRAYPVGEAYGTQGALFSTEWQANLARLGAPALTVSGFFDIGTVRQLKDDDYPGAPLVNRETLKGAGLWAEWRPWPPTVALRLTLAHPIGHHPNPTAAGTNQDGSRLGATRAWASANLTF